MKNLNFNKMEVINGGICTSWPGNAEPFPCFDPCQIAIIASNGNAPFFCIL